MSDTASIMPEHPPVTDWIHDFDHTDPRWTENPFPIWEQLRIGMRRSFTPTASSAATCRPPTRR